MSSIVKKQAVQPKIIMKGHQSFRHDLYRFELDKMKIDDSWRLLQPKIVEIEHSHTFHSYDSKGKKLTYCSPVGGHFHKVEPYIDEKGDMKAKCGPPMRTAHRRLRNGKMRELIEPVSYAMEDQRNGEITKLMDNHEHSITYKFSEILSPEKIKKVHEQNAAQLKAMQRDIPQFIPSEKKDLSAAEGEIKEL